MKDPRRLLDGDGTEEQRALLRAAALEEPAPEDRARLLVALGVTLPAGTGEGLAGTQSTAPAGLASGSGAIGAAKLVAIALGSVVVLGTGVMLWARGEERASTSTTASTSASTSTSTSALAGDEQASHSAGRAGAVALEIEAIERVRSELGRKDGQAALAALRRYSSEHPHGVLAHEADVLRVEALWLEGDADAARELAEQLLRRHGDSPHRARLEALARQAGAAPAR